VLRSRPADVDGCGTGFRGEAEIAMPLDVRVEYRRALCQPLKSVGGGFTRSIRTTAIIPAWSAMKRTKVACAVSDQVTFTGSRRTPQP
jgi:hypothetical protein